jgi:hypothetical protein
MPKAKFLYYGTTEKVGKSAPTAGIDQEKVNLTTFFAAYQAFSAAKMNEKWAIIEVSLAKLTKSHFSPYKFKKRGNEKSWEKTTENNGLCVYSGGLPNKSINRVLIYDPRSNWLITRIIIHNKMDPNTYLEKIGQLSIIHRWLTGEFMMLDVWIKEQKIQFTKDQKEQFNNVWHERTGLDLFYQSPQK